MIGSKFIGSVLPEIMTQGPYESVFSVICANDYHFAITMVIPLWTCMFGFVRYFLYFSPMSSNWLYLKGRGAGLEPELFKNVRDYNQMIRYARKYEEVH